MSENSRENTSNVILYRCEKRHPFFHRHDACPHCGLPLVEFAENARAVVISQTRVRVNPTGTPYRLGIAEVECGARTLCLIDGDVPPADGVSVTLARKKNLYHALSVPTE
jgi:uncharacterized OB-fold protein